VDERGRYLNPAFRARILHLHEMLRQSPLNGT
jgi:hypothetical protein